MNWHIIGSNSYIAQRLLPRLRNEKVFCYGRRSNPEEIYLDLTDIDETVYDRIKPNDFVVVFAAVSSPDICQNRYETAYALNVVGTEAFIQNCTRRNARVLFFSSDAVLGSAPGPNYEDVVPFPLGNYAKMKREVEQDLMGEKNLKIFRLSYVFSWKDKFTRYLRQCQESGEIPDVYDALYRNVVYIEDLIDAILSLAGSFDTWENQIFHICGSDLLSRKDLAEIYRQEVDPSMAYTTSVPGAAFFEARPNIIEMRSNYFAALLGRQPTKIADAMHQEERIYSHV